MGQLTNAFVAANQPTMSSREIAELVDSRHDKVKQSIERLVERGVIVQPPLGDEPETDALGRTRVTKVYEISKRDSYVIVAQLSPEFTARLVDRWQELEQASRFDPSQLTRMEVLQLAMDAERDLHIERERRVAVEAAKTELEHRVEQDAPKVAFAERIAALPGSVSVASAAQTLGTGQNRLFAFMRSIGWLQTGNVPYQRKIDDGCLENKPSPYLHPRDGSLQHSYTTLVTARGLVRLQRAWSGRQAERASAAA